MSEADVARRLDVRIVWLGLNRGDVARIVGVDSGLLSKYFMANRFPRRTLEKIAHLLGLEIGVVEGGSIFSFGRALLSPHPIIGRARISKRPKALREEVLRGLSIWFDKTWSDPDVIEIVSMSRDVSSPGAGGPR